MVDADGCGLLFRAHINAFVFVILVVEVDNEPLETVIKLPIYEMPEGGVESCHIFSVLII
jgi:hypothetical protein